MSTSSHNPAYVPGPTFWFMKLLASSGSHCTKWADEQHRPAGFESQLVPDLPLPFIPTLVGLRAFDLVSSRVWWEAATNKQRSFVFIQFTCFKYFYLIQIILFSTVICSVKWFQVFLCKSNDWFNSHLFRLFGLMAYQLKEDYLIPHPVYT